MKRHNSSQNNGHFALPAVQRHVLETEICPEFTSGETYFLDGDPIIFKEYMAKGRLHFVWTHNLQPLQIDDADRNSPLVDAAWATRMLAEHRLKGISEIALMRSQTIEAPEYDFSKVLEIDPAAEYRIEVLRALDKIDEKRNLANIVKVLKAVEQLYPAAAKAYGKTPDVRTVRNWLKQRGTPGARSYVACMSRQGRTKRASRIHEVVRKITLQKGVEYYAIRSLKKNEAYDNVVAAVDREIANRVAQGRSTEGIRPPCRATVFQIFDSMADYDTYSAKYGCRHARRLFKAHGVGLSAKSNLELCIIDHTVLDCIAVDEEFGNPIGRPVLSVMLDVHSRCVLAFVLSFEPASLYGALECLRRANSPKIGCWLSDEFPALARIFGKPREIICDNGLEFVGVSFRQSLYDLGIIVRFCPIKEPQYKAIGERFFGTLNSIGVHNWPGTTLNKQKQMLLEGSVDTDPILSLHELEELIWKAISTYHIDQHSSLNQPPAHVWVEYAKRHSIPYFKDDSILLKMLGASDDRSLSPKGVRFANMHYGGGELDGLIKDLRPASLKRGKGTPIRVPIKFNPINIHSIYAWNDRTKKYVELICEDPEYADGLTKFQHDYIGDQARLRGMSFSTPEQRRNARIALRAENYVKHPKLLQRDRRRAERLHHKLSVKWEIGDTATGVLEYPLVNADQEPFADNRKDGGALPKAKARGASKAAKTRAANKKQAKPEPQQAGRLKLTFRHFDSTDAQQQIKGGTDE